MIAKLDTYKIARVLVAEYVFFMHCLVLNPKGRFSKYVSHFEKIRKHHDKKTGKAQHIQLRYNMAQIFWKICMCSTLTYLSDNSLSNALYQKTFSMQSLKVK